MEPDISSFSSFERKKTVSSLLSIQSKRLGSPGSFGFLGEIKSLVVRALSCFSWGRTGGAHWWAAHGERALVWLLSLLFLNSVVMVRRPLVAPWEQGEAQLNLWIRCTEVGSIVRHAAVCGIWIISFFPSCSQPSFRGRGFKHTLSCGGT